MARGLPTSILVAAIITTPSKTGCKYLSCAAKKKECHDVPQTGPNLGPNLDLAQTLVISLTAPKRALQKLSSHNENALSPA